MPVSPDSYTFFRLKERLGHPPPEAANGRYDLAGADLARLGLNQAVLDECDLRGANLRGANLRRASLRRALLTGADLSGALLPDADLRQADLRGARLGRAVLFGTLVDGADFTGCEWTACECRDVRLWRATSEQASAEGEPGSLTPEQVSEAIVSLRGLFEQRPEHDTPQLLAWTAHYGGEQERDAVRAARERREWREWRGGLDEVLRRFDRRLGPLNAASLSVARPVAGQRSLSAAKPGAAQQGGALLSWLPQWLRRSKQEPDEG